MEEEWELSDLLNTNRMAELAPPSDENINILVNNLHSYWIPEEDDEDNFIPEPSELFSWGASRFGMELNSVSFSELHDKYKRRQFQLIALSQLWMQSSLSEDNMIKDKLIRIANCIKHTYDSFKEMALLYHRMDPGRELRIPDDAPIDYIFNYSADKLTNFQKLLIHFTKILEIAEFRKMEDQCWVQIKNSTGHPTQAWRQETTIKDFLCKMVQKETDFQNWQYMTNPQDNGDKVIKHIIDYEQANFPSLTVDRHKWSYENGIYDASTDTFWEFGEEHLWHEQATALETYRRNKGWGDKYVIEPPSGVNMTVKFFEQPFRFRINPQTEESFDATKIKLPELEKVFDSQKLDADTKDWVLIMLARLFFKVGEKDKWQVVFFIKGVAGSGKSTLAKLIRYMYPPNLISTLSSNVEAKFGLSAIYKGLICICAEVREDFGLDQADWQSAASGEEMSIAIKNKTAIQHLWDTPFFFLGNEVPNYKNASGSVDRRIFMIEFNFKVRGSDPYLFDKIVANLDLFHRKCVSMYLDKIRQHGDKDIWSSTPNILPQQIYDFKNNMRSSVDCLYNFLKGPGFEFNDSYQMPVADFKELYAVHRKANGEEKCRWNREHYASTFQELGISVIRGTMTSANGKTHTGEIIVGIQAKAEEEADT